MDKEYVDKFIDQIEDLLKISDEDEYVQDEAGKYQKVSYLKNLIFEAKYLIEYGEYRIALENMLENLNEVSILLDKETIGFARKAFGSHVSAYMEQLLCGLTKL